MSDGAISLLFSLGVAAWIFAKVSHLAGNSNTKMAWSAAAGAFVFAFIVIFTILKFVVHL